MSTCLCSVCFWKMSSIGNVSCTCIYWFAKCIHHLRLCNNFLQSAYMYIDTLCSLYTLCEVSIYLYFMIYNLIWIFKMGVLSVIFTADENIMCGFFFTQCVAIMCLLCKCKLYDQLLYTVYNYFLLELMCILYIQLFVFYDLY